MQQNGGRFWLVTPEGHPFFNLGINHLASGMDNAQRADVALATELTRKFKSWHFNTAGYNASPLFAKDTPFVSFLNLVPTSRFLRDKASFPDVFDAAFQRDLQTRIEHQCRDVRDNPRLLGYVWTDTPLWNLKDARRTIKKDWVSTLRQLAAAAPGKIAYVDFLLETHGGDFAKIAQIYDVKATSRAELLAAPFDAVRVDAPPSPPRTHSFCGASRARSTASPVPRIAKTTRITWSGERCICKACTRTKCSKKPCRTSMCC